VRHGWLLARLLTGLRRRLLAFWLLVCRWRRASLCSAQVDVRKGSRCTTCQLRSDRGRTWSRRCETMVTISSLARRRLLAIIWLLTDRRLLCDTSQLLKSLRNRIKIFLRLFLLLLLLLVRRGHVENIVTNIELEVGARISWFRAGRRSATLNSIARSGSSSKALRWAGILLRVSASGRCPCVPIAIGRSKSCWGLDFVLALSPCEGAVEEAPLLCHRALFNRAGFR